jgi:hypothetical protein
MIILYIVINCLNRFLRGRKIFMGNQIEEEEKNYQQ